MRIYQRGEKYLVVMPELPQWFILDEFGVGVAAKIESGRKLSAILTMYPLHQRQEVREVYAELIGLMTAGKDSRLTGVGHSLTARTTVAMICLTRACNMRCAHCYVDATGRRGGELDLSEHEKLARDLRSCLAVDKGVIYKVNLTGGEPFLHPQVMKIVKAYRENDFGVTISTNGVRIKDFQMAGLRDFSVALSISLDGSTGQTHDFIRGRGNFKQTLEKIRKLRDADVDVGINHLVHRGNFHELEELIDLCHSFGCNGFNPINLVQLGRACGSKLERVSEVEIFSRIAKHLEARPEQIGMFEFSSLFSSIGAALLTGITCVNCGIASRPCVYIDEQGGVYPCPNTQKAEFMLGNIRDRSLAECVDVKHPVLKRLAKLHVDKINPTCGKCDVRYFCGGDCRGETYNVTGDLTAPYVACRDRHDSIVELMWIVAESPHLFETRSREYETMSRRI